MADSWQVKESDFLARYEGVGVSPRILLEISLTFQVFRQLDRITSTRCERVLLEANDWEMRSDSTACIMQQFFVQRGEHLQWPYTDGMTSWLVVYNFYDLNLVIVSSKQNRERQNVIIIILHDCRWLTTIGTEYTVRRVMHDDALPLLRSLSYFCGMLFIYSHSDSVVTLYHMIENRKSKKKFKQSDVLQQIMFLLVEVDFHFLDSLLFCKKIFFMKRNFEKLTRCRNVECLWHRP